MRTYRKITVKIGSFDHDIESWSEHNHTSVYSGGFPLFDGYGPKANHAIKEEIARLEELARTHNTTFEVLN